MGPKFETYEHFLDEWSTISSSEELSEKFEEYQDIKKTLRQKSTGAYFKNKQDFKGAEKYRKFESSRKFEHNRADKKLSASTSYNRHHGSHATGYGNQQRSYENSNRGYSRNNGEREIFKSQRSKTSLNKLLQISKIQKVPEKELNAAKPKKASNSTKETNKSAETCAIIEKESLRTKEIMFGNKKVTALIDTGSTVSLLRENTSRRIIDPTKLAKNKILLTELVKHKLLR
ncbi:hypothetical protein AVEN_38457-1 [Araneus ventricosus]|uniref:Peptidase A2 domain-containing protein n=1 Tax=Araneus ventricosus TaxID=182803 RepID=A0A4Y2H4R9_ARAVE|nr:hypothetical protein AVEN_38457-1 [Araneus ventricosus]